MLTNRREVISICSSKHLPVWKLTSKAMVKFLEADSYLVYVPRNEKYLFRSVTPKEIEIRTQEEISGSFYQLLKESMKNSKNLSRFGWYLQQFYKFQALLSSGAEQLVIWDSDCVPLRPIELFDYRQRPVYLRAEEYNPLYFDTIAKLLGLRKVVEFSFVVPGFPFYANWMKDCIQMLEERGGKPWYECIISCTDLSKRSAFSETETLGTWLTHHFPDEIKTADWHWERSGQSKFGYAKNFTLEKLLEVNKASNLDIVSFENWDLRGTRLLARKTLNLVLNKERRTNQTRSQL